jgi:hypothetical protein
MPPLDPKEEAIVAAYIRNGGDQSKAWRSCHPESKASLKTINEKASRFFAQGKVRARIVELQAQVAAQSVTAAALTLDAHMEMLRELRDKADQRGQTSAAIRAEELRGQLRRFYVKQVETGDAGEFERMSIEELREYVYGQGKILATLDEKLPPKGPKGPVKH